MGQRDRMSAAVACAVLDGQAVVGAGDLLVVDGGAEDLGAVAVGAGCRAAEDIGLLRCALSGDHSASGRHRSPRNASSEP